MNPRRATAWAPVNIALVKHWGTARNDPALPARSSLSLALEHGATTTVELVAGAEDSLVVGGRSIGPGDGEKAAAAYGLLARVREAAGLGDFGAQATSESDVPLGGGMASSAAGGAAATLAALAAAGLLERTTEDELLALCASTGSLSALRSLRGGIVRLDPEGGRLALSSLGSPLDLTVLSCLVETRPKIVSSSAGHARARTSPFFPAFEAAAEERLAAVGEALLRGDLRALAELVEAEALAMHAVMLTSRPSIVYATDATWSVFRLVAAIRAEGIEACCTLDAGPNPHVLCATSQADEVARHLAAAPEVLRVMRSRLERRGAHVVS